MTEPVTVTRQATFDAEPADAETVSGNSIRRGTVVIPVVGDSPNEIKDRNIVPYGNSSPTCSNSSLQNYKLHSLKSHSQHSSGLPANAENLSKTEILSDKTQAGDSDDPPTLSLSLKKKLRKEPRIRVPGIKFDSAEPTTVKQTTHDVLPKTTTNGSIVVPEIKQTDTRSDTIIIDSSSRKSVSFNLTPEIFPHSPGSQKFENHKTHERSEKEAGALTAREGNSQGDPASALNKSVFITVTPHNSKKRSPAKNTYRRLSFKFNKRKGLELFFPNNDWHIDDCHIQNNTETSKVLDNTEKQDNSAVNDNTTPGYEPSTNDLYKLNSLTQTSKQLKVSDEHSKTISTNVCDTTTEQKASIFTDYTTQPHKPSESSLLEENELGQLNKPNAVLNKKTESNFPGDHQNIVINKNSTEIKLVSGAGLDTEKRRATYEVNQPEITEIKSDNAIVKPSENEHLRNHTTRYLLFQSLDREVSSKVDDLDFTGVSDKNINEIHEKRGPLSGHSDPRNTTSLNKFDSLSVPTTTPSLSASRMASSGRYVYEGDSLEAVTKERNALLQSERVYHKRIKQLEEELKSMVNQCQILSNENKQLRRALDSMERSKEGSALRSQSNASAETTARVAKLETEREHLIKANENLSSRLKDRETSNSDLEKKVQGLRKQIENLSLHAEQSDLENKKIQHSMNLQIQALHQDKETLSTRLDEKQQELSELTRAIQAETLKVENLKESNAKLGKAEEDKQHLGHELKDLKKLLQDVEEGRKDLQEQVARKDFEIRKLKDDQNINDNLITELRNTIERSKQEIRKLEETKEEQSDMEKTMLHLKSRIDSLTAEIDSRRGENTKLKQKCEEMNQEIERLHKEKASMADTVAESTKYLNKWENERDARNRVEVNLASKEEEVRLLERRVQEALNTSNILSSRAQVLEDERVKSGASPMQELETDNKILKDENRKLRQMLVERNIELTNKTTEKQAIDSKLQILERKQKDTEVRVQQLSGWVEDVKEQTQTDKQSHGAGQIPKLSTKGNFSSRPLITDSSRNTLHRKSDQRLSLRNRNDKSFQAIDSPIFFVSPRSRKQNLPKGLQKTVTPPSGWGEEGPRESDDRQTSNLTPVSLPLISDIKSVTSSTSHGGYVSLYKDKLKRMNGKKI